MSEGRLDTRRRRRREGHARLVREAARARCVDGRHLEVIGAAGRDVADGNARPGDAREHRLRRFSACARALRDIVAARAGDRVPFERDRHETGRRACGDGRRENRRHAGLVREGTDAGPVHGCELEEVRRAILEPARRIGRRGDSARQERFAARDRALIDAVTDRTGDRRPFERGEAGAGRRRQSDGRAERIGRTRHGACARTRCSRNRLDGRRLGNGKRCDIARRTRRRRAAVERVIDRSARSRVADRDGLGARERAAGRTEGGCRGRGEGYRADLGGAVTDLRAIGGRHSKEVTSTVGESASQEMRRCDSRRDRPLGAGNPTRVHGIGARIGGGEPAQRNLRAARCCAESTDIAGRGDRLGGCGIRRRRHIDFVRGRQREPKYRAVLKRAATRRCPIQVARRIGDEALGPRSIAGSRE